MALGANGEEERSLRDDLAASMKEIEEREASEAAAAPKDDEPAAAEAEAKVEPADEKADRGDGRDAHGRFLPKAKEEGQASDEVSSTSPDLPKPESSQAETSAAPSLPSEDQPPKSWRSDEASAWKDTPPAAKAAILRREADAAKLAGHNDAERMFGREMAEIFRPHVQEIQAAGANPQQAVKQLLANHNDLRNPQTQVATARRLLAQYGIDPSQVAQPDPNAPSDPFVVQLQNEIAQLKARLGPTGQPQTQQQFAPLPPSQEEFNVEAALEAFRSDPAHPHFEAVGPTMGKLLETGAATDLESAYHAAVAMDPALRSTAIAPQRTQEEKTAAARRASASVTSSPGPAGTPRPITMRDELAEGLRSAGFRL